MGADRADRLNIRFHFKVMLKLSRPDVSGRDEPMAAVGRHNVLAAEVSETGADAVMWLPTVNTTLLKTSKTLAMGDSQSNILYTHTQTHTVWWL